MRPHEGEPSQRGQDIVDDLFDLGLVAFAVVWLWTGINLDNDLLAKVALTGAGVRAASRRIFRAFFGPRITRWVQRHVEHEAD